MGVKNAMPVDRDVFDYYIRTVHRLFGTDAPWCAAGIGAHQVTLNEWAIAAGGHARTGLEDNVRPDRTTLAPSNAARCVAPPRSPHATAAPSQHPNKRATSSGSRR